MPKPSGSALILFAVGVAILSIGCKPRVAANLVDASVPSVASQSIDAGAPPVVAAPSSDEWVAREFHVQRRPARVLVVDASGAKPKSVRIRPTDLNARDGGGDAEDLAVTASYRTLQEAADAAHGGDLVAVMPGAYQGFYLGDDAASGDGRFIQFKALGAPGAVVVNRANAHDASWMILLEAAHHVTIEGFEIAGTDSPGDAGARGPRAGILLTGSFRRTGKLAHHVAIVGSYLHHHREWGFHSTDTRAVLLQDDVFAFSAREHGAYVSDGSDEYVIRRNVFFGNYACGLQCNLDPLASLEEVAAHPALRDHPPFQPTRAWAEGLLDQATRLFGENGFPDGRGRGFVIEDNVVNGNGRRGGAAINLAGLQRSTVRNNVVYGNYAHGIAQWDNDNPFDADAVKHPPQTPADARPEKLPLFGCRENVFRGNLVVMSRADRAAMQSIHGSFGTLLYDNVLLNDAGPSIEIDATSVGGFGAWGNLFRVWSDDAMPAALRTTATQLPDGGGNESGVTSASFAARVVRFGDQPWIVVDGGWWRPNPARPDFRRP